MDIWKYDMTTNQITPVIKSETTLGKGVRFLTLGTFAKQSNLKQLQLKDEDFFYSQPIMQDQRVLLMGEENVHVVNFQKWTTDIRKWETPAQRASERLQSTVTLNTEPGQEDGDESPEPKIEQNQDEDDPDGQVEAADLLDPSYQQ